MRVTIKEVAIEAGVSLSTVSRVLHNNSKITEETKDRVNKAIKKLGYHPNFIASSLAGKPTKTIGIVIPNDSDELFKNTFFINAMRGISIYAQKKGYFLMYSFSKNDEEEVRFIEKYIRSGWVSGIVLLNAYENDKCINYLKDNDFPFVIIGSPSESKDINWVDNNNYDAMAEVVELLISKGKKNIAFIGGSKNLRVTKDRFAGYLSVLEKNKITPQSGLHFFRNSFSESEGYNCTMEIIYSGIEFDSIVTTDDLYSYGALKALEESGRKNIMVTGFNNTPKSSYINPSLTTVEINADELGENAARLLIEHLENKNLKPSGVLINSNLIERETTT
ncbi:MAG: LacI family DNA-binding transcriptional regulator [Spirochaetales bacterium]|nr:LacI family DNA-binding transcriptional regulator [Spirochaetales bacterium]